MRRTTRVIVFLAGVLIALALGACSDPTAPACEPGTAEVKTFTLVEDSLGIHEVATVDTVPTTCPGGF